MTRPVSVTGTYSAGPWDAIIVGAGTSGMACAIAAAEGGARVCLVEKDSEVGGTLHLSAGQMSAACTRRQLALDVDDSTEAHFDEVMKLGHGRNDPAVVRLAVEGAPDTLDWLDDLGFPFPDEMPIMYYGHEPYSKPRTAWGPEMGVSILKTIQPVFEDLAGAGRIELRLGHRLVELITTDGRVDGVRVATDGGEQQLRAPVTVLTSGGYAANPELFAEFHPDVHCLLGARETSTGDGLNAARAIGAALRGADLHLPTSGCIPMTNEPGRTDIWDAFGNLVPQTRRLREIIVNRAGKRFQREDEPSADARERALVAEGGRAWVILDEAMLTDDDPVVVGWSADMLRAEAAAGERAWVGHDATSLARSAGIDPGGLAATIADYNDAIAVGTDSLGREMLDAAFTSSPIYAIGVHAGAVVGFAGVDVDDRLRVVSDDGQPIDGLYAAGEILGASASMGNGFSGGMMVTPALTLGRTLGDRIARMADGAALAG